VAALTRKELFAAAILGQMAGRAFADGRFNAFDRWWAGSMALKAHVLATALEEAFTRAEATAESDRPWLPDDLLHAFHTGLELGREETHLDGEDDDAA